MVLARRSRATVSNLDFLHFDSQGPAADNCESIVPTFSWSGSAQFTGKSFQGFDVDTAKMNYLRRRTL